MSDYVRTYWVDESDPDVTADELNRIEQGIVDAHAKADSLLSRVADLLARASQILDALNVHVADRANPHQVTGAQLGVDVVAAQLAAHKADFNNPHQVTVDQAKAAG